MSVVDPIKKIAKSYDQDVDDFRNDKDPEANIPDSIKESEAYKFIQENGGSNSGSPEVKGYLSPQAGMNFLDIGSCANLFTYDLDKWESEYYGIDISPKLIESMKKVAVKRDIKVGDLAVADMAKLPFDDSFFNIAAVIGVLEYYDIEYIENALAELNRVMKIAGRAAIDMPNLEHPHVETMFETEKLKGRTYTENMSTREEFEDVLKKYFSINKLDDSGVMTMYFVERK